MIEPPPRELADLFAAEKSAPAVTAIGKRVLRARIAATVGHAPLGAATSGAAIGVVAKVLTVLALVVGTSVAVRGFNSHDEAAGAANLDGVSTPSVPIARELDQMSIEVVSSDAPSPAPLLEKPRLSRASVPAEAKLLAAAWTSIEAGDGARALELTDLDAKLHPRGGLSEERDALRILALAKLQRTTEARDAGNAFLSRFPTSVHRPLIENVVESKESP